MNTMRILAAGAFATAIAVTTVSAQQPQTQRVRGTIEKVDGNTLLIKAPTGGAPITLTLADNAVVVGVLKATVADIKEGSYIGSGAMPQPDGTQKAVEVHIFAESQRGTGDGHRPNWDGSSYGAGVGTMTNGAVGQAVSSVDGPVITVKYKDGEKKVVVGPNTPIVRYEVGEKSELKPGAAVSVVAATKKPDGTFSAARINVGRNGVVPM
jgi:outer membrane lipoprotein SlyB